MINKSIIKIFWTLRRPCNACSLDGDEIESAGILILLLLLLQTLIDEIQMEYLPSPDNKKHQLTLKVPFIPTKVLYLSGQTSLRVVVQLPIKS